MLKLVILQLFSYKRKLNGRKYINQKLKWIEVLFDRANQLAVNQAGASKADYTWFVYLCDTINCGYSFIVFYKNMKTTCVFMIFEFS